MNPKLPIAGSATSDTAGVYLTRKGAQRYAEKEMRGDLLANYEQFVKKVAA